MVGGLAQKHAARTRASHRLTVACLCIQAVFLSRGIGRAVAETYKSAHQSVSKAKGRGHTETSRLTSLGALLTDVLHGKYGQAMEDGLDVCVGGLGLLDEVLGCIRLEKASTCAIFEVLGGSKELHKYTHVAQCILPHCTGAHARFVHESKQHHTWFSELSCLVSRRVHNFGKSDFGGSSSFGGKYGASFKALKSWSIAHTEASRSFCSEVSREGEDSRNDLKLLFEVSSLVIPTECAI